MFGYQQHPAPIQIVDPGEVVVPFGKRLLIDAESLDGLSLTAQQAAFDRALLNRMHLVPTQSESLGHGLLAGGLEPIDRQSFKQSREPAGGLGPRKLYGSCAMVGGGAGRGVGLQGGLVLTRVPMAPPAVPPVGVERAPLAGLPTQPPYS